MRRWWCGERERRCAPVRAGEVSDVMNLYVISYDVPDTRRRTRMADTLLGFGERVQRSVFECILDDGQYHDLRQRMDRIVNAATDSVRYYNLGAVRRADVEVQGLGTLSVLPQVYVV